jgi:hypothetical protein
VRQMNQIIAREWTNALACLHHETADATVGE